MLQSSATTISLETPIIGNLLSRVSGSMLSATTSPISFVCLFFYLGDGLSIEKANSFTNILTIWKSVFLMDCTHWREFLNVYGSHIDIESDDWMMGVLGASMELDLKAEIRSDMEDIPVHQQSTNMMLYLVTKHIFARNQEAKDTM